MSEIELEIDIPFPEYAINRPVRAPLLPSSLFLCDDDDSLDSLSVSPVAAPVRRHSRGCSWGEGMSSFSDAELAYLSTQPVCRPFRPNSGRLAPVDYACGLSDSSFLY